jgi:hypothetical protein
MDAISIVVASNGGKCLTLVEVDLVVSGVVSDLQRIGATIQSVHNLLRSK